MQHLLELLNELFWRRRRQIPAGVGLTRVREAVTELALARRSDEAITTAEVVVDRADGYLRPASDLRQSQRRLTVGLEDVNRDGERPLDRVVASLRQPIRES